MIDEEAEPDDPQKLRDSMTKEMTSVKDFDVYEEITVEKDSPLYDQALPCMWVHRDKGYELRSRLVCKGCYQTNIDKDGVYASTPLLTSLKILLTIATARHYIIRFGDVSTAFLHADLEETIYVIPHENFTTLT